MQINLITTDLARTNSLSPAGSLGPPRVNYLWLRAGAGRSRGARQQKVIPGNAGWLARCLLTLHPLPLIELSHVVSPECRCANTDEQHRTVIAVRIGQCRRGKLHQIRFLNSFITYVNFIKRTTLIFLFFRRLFFYSHSLCFPSAIILAYVNSPKT